MNYIYSIILVLLFSSSASASEALTFSVRGTWDITKNPERAQFGGNNKFINNYFVTTYPIFLSPSSEVNDIWEISFNISTDGLINNIKLKNNIDPIFDLLIIQIIESMSGKWRPGSINGTSQSEEMTLWINIYKGKIIKKSLNECIEKAEKLIINKNYTKAIQYLDIALEYDEFNMKAINLRVDLFKEMRKYDELCKFLNENSVYFSVKVNDLQKENCKK